MHATIGIRVDGVVQDSSAQDGEEDVELMEFSEAIKMKKTTKKV